MKKFCFLSLIACLVSVPAFAMSEQECANQAKAAYTLMEMIESGVIPASKTDKQRLEQVMLLINREKYCDARAYLLFTQKNMSGEG